MDQENVVESSRFPLRFYAAALFFTAIFLSLLGWNAYHSFRLNQTIRENDFQLQQFKGAVVYLDEVLTMSARMAAATADSAWEDRYREFETQWNQVLSQAETMAFYKGDVPLNPGYTRNKLRQIENLVFHLVRQDRLFEARAIMFGEEYEEQKQIYNKGFPIFTKTHSPEILGQELRDLILYLDEVLTMSAMMAATMGDFRWEQRYRSFEPQLDIALKQAMDLVPYGERAVRQTEEANKKLVAMENRAFSLVRKGDLKEAQALLKSQAYREQKQIYAKGMDRFTEHLEENTKSILSWERKKAVISIIAVIGVLPFLLFAWLAVLRTLRKWQSALLGVNRHLSQKTVELEQANQGLSKEIAERIRVEDALRDSKARFSGILDIAHEAIISIDEEHRILLYNKGAEQIFGFSQEEAVGQPLELLLPQRFHTKHRRHVKEFSSSDSSARRMGGRSEIYGKRKNGEEFLAEASISKLEVGGEKIFTVVLRDITERKRAERELRTSEERFRQLTENIKEVFWMGDIKNNKMIYISPAYEEIWGRPRENLYTSLDSWLETIHPDNLGRQGDFALAIRGEYQDEYQIVRPDGSMRWIRDRAFPIRDHTGQIYRLAGIAEDVTEQKMAEQTLKRRETQQKALSEIGGLCLKMGLLKEAMEIASQLVVETLGVDLFDIFLLNEEGNSFTLEAAVGYPEILIGKAMVPNHQGSLPGYTLMVNGPVLIEDFNQETRMKSSQLLNEISLTSALSVPLVSQGGAIGVMGVYCKQYRRFSPDDQEFLQGVANLIAVAVSRKRAEEALAEQAVRDALTGLYNRRYFNTRLEEEITRATRNDQSLAILLCDLDRFKAINDSRGHEAGDAVLKEVAESIQDSTRGIDLVFRWGGDEFVVVLSDPTREGILTAANRIRKGIGKINRSHRTHLDMSIGVALYPEHGRNGDELIRLADWALYIAKKGGDKIHIGEEEYHLNEDSIKVVFQPVVDLNRNQTMGYEALSRDPQGKLSILELFQRYQAIGQLFELKSLCFRMQFKRAREAGLKRVFINVDFTLLGQLEPFEKPPSMDIVLEISEMEALHDVENHLMIARKWRSKGFKFAIDDFGAGFISLPFIAQLIPEFIKLDRSTVLQSVASEEFRRFSHDLVRALKNYSKEGIIAEGIENEEELKVLKEMKVHIAQGFLLGRPQEIHSLRQKRSTLPS